MGLGYTRWTEEQDKARLLIDDGDYHMRIVAMTRKRTKNGQHTMVEIDFAFKDFNDRERKMRDWIVFMPDMDWKLRHLAKSADSVAKDTRLLDLYDSDQLDIPHMMGRVVIGRIGNKDSDNGKMNFVKDYLISGTEKVKSQSALPVDEFKDCTDIPF